MEITLMTNYVSYYKTVEAMLLKKEACNNLPLGIIERLLNKKVISSTPILGEVKEEGELLYTFVQTPPHNLVLPDVDNIDKQVINNIVEFLLDRHLEVPGVIGHDSLAKTFAEHWSKKKGTAYSLHMKQYIYQLDQVANIPLAQGKLEQAQQKDEQLLAKWLVLFGEQAKEPISQKQAADMVQRFIQAGSAFLWKVNGNPVSMVNQSRKSNNGASINAVFTPDNYKCHGYATAAVATLSKKLLEEGYSFCSLYTDAQNPTSNSIYKKIGYYPVGSSTVYNFEAR